MSARTPHTHTHTHKKQCLYFCHQVIVLVSKVATFFLKCQAATFFICSGWWSDSRSMTLEELSIGGTRVAMSSSHRLPCCRHVATVWLSPEIIFHLKLTVTGSAWSHQAAILPLVGCCLSIFFVLNQISAVFEMFCRWIFHELPRSQVFFLLELLYIYFRNWICRCQAIPIPWWLINIPNIKPAAWSC